MNETQKTISEWATQTFGVPENLDPIVDRFLEEVDELASSTASVLTLEELQSECADCLIVLYQVAQTGGFDLHEAVNNKMQINRSRKWDTKGDGVGQHIED